MAYRFQPLFAVLLLLVSDAVALKTTEVADRPHKEISPPVVLSKAHNDDDDAADAKAEEEQASEAEEPAAEDEEKKDEESKEEDKEESKDEEPKEEDKEEKAEEPKEEEKEEEESSDVQLPPAAAAFYGPGGCVATFRSPEGTCIMQTRCKQQDTETYEYGLTCVDDKGVSTRHLFGAGSFNAVETFDTLIKCNLCLGVDGDKGTPEMHELASDVSGLQSEMDALKADVKLIKDHLDLTTAAPEAEEKAEEDSSEEASDDSEEKTGFLHAGRVAKPAKFNPPVQKVVFSEPELTKASKPVKFAPPPHHHHREQQGENVGVPSITSSNPR